MANLNLTYKQVWVKISEYLGMGSSPTGDDLTKVKDLAIRGYKKFLNPIDLSNGLTYKWSFLNRTSTMSTQTSVDTYKLPVGFSGFVLPFTCISPLSWNPTEKPLEFIYLQKSMTTGEGYPRYFAVKTGDYDTIASQQNEVIFSPTPSSVINYYYTYIFTPPPPVEDDDVFIGNELMSEVILQCALATAELYENDGITGESTGLHAKESEKLLQAAIGSDKLQSQVSNLGQMYNGKNADGFTRSASIYLDSTRIIPE